MSDEFTITDEYIAEALASMNQERGNTPIEAFSKVVQSGLGGHLVVAPGLEVQEAFAQVSAAAPAADLVTDGSLVVRGRAAGLWRPLVFWHNESDADIVGFLVVPVVDAGSVDSHFIQSMDYLRDALGVVAPPLYYMHVSPAWGPDGNTKIGFTVAPDMVGNALVAMSFLPPDSVR